ncbi:acyl-CoA dehydrogenase family protein [Paraburkholderia tropica]|uniref:acyl-CoA dehydrogenase family protein n=1 Tax=Paraburkholderia tropica TaxID=92647 RepID=UPI002AB7C17B|nr:acyl-CoA dehydrogenase family protein [Paraburkholderia tropica]
MSFNLTSRQQKLLETAKALSAEFSANSKEYDDRAEFPVENFARLHEAGLLGLAVPEAYGGSGSETGNAHLAAYLVTEAISRGCSGLGWDLIIHYHQCGAVTRLGNEEQKTRILGDVVKNGAIMGSLGSEVNHQQQTAPSNASRKLTFDAQMMPVEGGFRATAAKHFCSNAPAADYMLYWSLAPGTQSMGEGLTLSIVTKGSPGLNFQRNGWDDIIGLRSSVSVSATLDDVFIPWKNVLGEPGDFIQKDPYTLELSQAFHLVGSAQGAFDCIAKTLKDRPFLQKEEGLMVTFGEFSSAIQAARGSCLLASSLWDERQFGEAALASLRAHHMAREVALDVATRGFDLIGTRSLFKTMPLQRYWRDIRTASLHTRDSQLVRLIADADLAGEYAPKQKYGARVDELMTWEKLGLKREGAAVAA